MVRINQGSPSALPRLYLIADVNSAERLGVDLVDVVSQFVRAGGRMVSLRPGDVDDRRFLEIGAELAGLLFASRGVFLVHRRVDLAIVLGADGVHLPSRGIDRRELRHLLSDTSLIGRSCHRRSQVEYCDRRNWNFVTLGPFFESISKPGYGPKLDLDELAKWAPNLDIPVYALGGVVPDKIESCVEAGAAGVAVVGGILGADSPFAATREYLDAIACA